MGGFMAYLVIHKFHDTEVQRALKRLTATHNTSNLDVKLLRNSLANFAHDRTLTQIIVQELFDNAPEDKKSEFLKKNGVYPIVDGKVNLSKPKTLQPEY